MRLREAMILEHHNHRVTAGQCSSRVSQTVEAPAEVVWSRVRDFERPQVYKLFIRSCVLRSGDGGVGSIREVRLVSGLPAVESLERLDRLDDSARVVSFTIIGGDHRLRNYRSTVSVHEEDVRRTVVIESYAVDVPPGSSSEDTCVFVDTIVRCNLMSLAKIAESLASC